MDFRDRSRLKWRNAISIAAACSAACTALIGDDADRFGGNDKLQTFAEFICIEPWRGVADPQGFDGEFTDKPGVFIVPPGGSEALTMQVEWLAG